MNMRSRIERVSDVQRRSLSDAAPSPKNNRKGDRHRLVEEKVKVSHAGGPQEVELINVSGGGAMIAASFEAQVWDPLHLHLGENGTIECAIRWIAGGRMGLEFAHETQLDCSAEEQAILLREVINRTYGSAHFQHETPKPAPSAGKDEDDDETRRAKRHPLIWSGTLSFGGQSLPVRLRNISATGAMVQCKSSVSRGTDAFLELGEGVSVPVTVNWAVGDQVGLRFHEHFDVTKLGRAVPEVAKNTWVRPSYLNKTEAPPSPWDPRWQRISLNEMNEELDGFLKR